MEKVEDLNIKNRTYYYFDDIIDIRKFESNLLKIDKKSHRDFDIYYLVTLQLKSLTIGMVILIMKIFVVLIPCI